MAEAEQEKTLTLAEQWSLQEKEEQTEQKQEKAEQTEQNEIPEKEEQTEQNEIPVETIKDEKPDDATPEEVAAEKTDEVPATEENTNAPEQPEQEEAEKHEETEEQEASDEKPEIKLETAPADFRFPTTNQTRHCFTRYIEYHRCIKAKGEGAPECDKFAKYYRSLCPSEWVERWNEQRENGTFPGPL